MVMMHGRSRPKPARAQRLDPIQVAYSPPSFSIISELLVINAIRTARETARIEISGMTGFSFCLSTFGLVSRLPVKGEWRVPLEEGHAFRISMVTVFRDASDYALRR